ncbi:hypothetical protein LCGC14_2211200 [marine sediment metagenome]|uniref:Response regulatory domain-containing protein n=1 Tax=marine sediment metagenome TaxID=412755 RepID=A0A0F9FR83_9ZZZZ
MTESNRKLKILIVEDSLILAETFVEYLTDRGHDVMPIVTKGEEAVDAALKGLPDLVIMDINLEGVMSGIEVAEQIAEHNDSIGFYFVSAYSHLEYKDRLNKIRNYKYFQKPVRLEDLDYIISDYLSSSGKF